MDYSVILKRPRKRIHRGPYLRNATDFALSLLANAISYNQQYIALADSWWRYLYLVQGGTIMHDRIHGLQFPLGN